MDQRLNLPAAKVENDRVMGKQFVISLKILETEVNYLTLSITHASSIWFAQHTSEGMFDRLTQFMCADCQTKYNRQELFVCVTKNNCDQKKWMLSKK